MLQQLWFTKELQLIVANELVQFFPAAVVEEELLAKWMTCTQSLAKYSLFSKVYIKAFRPSQPSSEIFVKL